VRSGEVVGGPQTTQLIEKFSLRAGFMALPTGAFLYTRFLFVEEAGGP